MLDHYSLLLSDLHFGDTRCSLHSMRTAEALVSKLKAYAPLKDIFLLGDILDLQLAGWAQAIEGRFHSGPSKRAVGFRYFLNFLIEQTGATNIVYVPGNHDYKIFDYHSVQRYLIAPLMTGKKLSGKVSYSRVFRESFLQGIVLPQGARFSVVYPHFMLKINGSRVVLTHGHLFDPTQGFSQEVAKIFKRADSLSRDEIAKRRKLFFHRVAFYQNVMSSFSIKRELRESFNFVYQPFVQIKKRLMHRRRKTFLTRAMKQSIRSYIAYCCGYRKIDGIIFGHTHFAGSAVLESGANCHVWNCGTFLKEAPHSPRGTFITVRHGRGIKLENAVQVHVLQ